jgi:hypothetical protein
MAEDAQLHYWGYVACPIGPVQEVLHAPLELIQHATTSASERTRGVLANLRARIGPIEISTDVLPRVDRVVENAPGREFDALTSVEFSWQGARRPEWFPLMQAKLSAWPIAHDETLIEFGGVYRPPLGVVGQAFDAVIGHRIAESTVQRFVEDVLWQVRRHVRA